MNKNADNYLNILEFHTVSKSDPSAFSQIRNQWFLGDHRDRLVSFPASSHDKQWTASANIPKPIWFRSHRNWLDHANRNKKSIDNKNIHTNAIKKNQKFPSSLYSCRVWPVSGVLCFPLMLLLILIFSTIQSQFVFLVWHNQRIFLDWKYIYFTISIKIGANSYSFA